MKEMMTGLWSRVESPFELNEVCAWQIKRIQLLLHI